MSESESHALIIQHLTTHALTEVMEFEKRTLACCAPQKEIKPACTFRAKQEVYDSFVFSPNGQYIALKTVERVYLWDRQQRRSLHIFGHACFVDALAFSRDGRFLVTMDTEKNLHIWDVQTGERVRSLSMDEKAKAIQTGVENVVVVMSYWDRLQGWDLKTGEQLYCIDEVCRGFTCMPDGKGIITTHIRHEGDFRTGDYRSWYSLVYRDIRSGAEVPERRLDFSKIELGEIAVTPDGKTAVSVCNKDKAIRFIDLHTGTVRQISYEHLKFRNMGGAQVSPRGDLFLVNYVDYHRSNLSLWHIPSGTCLEVIPEQWESAQFSPDGKEYVALSRLDGAINVWDIASGQTCREVVCHAVSQTKFALSPKGDTFVAEGRGNALIIWDLRKGHPMYHLTGHRDFINEIAISPDGSILVSSSQDNTVRLWDMRSGRCINIWRFSRRPFKILFSPDGRYLAVDEGHAREEQWVSIRDIRTGNVINQIQREELQDQLYAFCRDGRSLLMGKSIKSLRIWDFWTGAVRPYTGETELSGNQTKLLVLQDGKSCLICGDHQRIEINELGSGRVVFCLEGHEDQISAMTRHPLRHTLISADDANQIREWDLSDGTCLRTFDGLPPCWWRWRHTRTLAISQDGGLLIAVSYDGVISIWDYESGRFLATGYLLDEGYLWTTPPDDFARDGWLHTNRPDLISLTAVDEHGKIAEYVPRDDERYLDYLRLYNDGEMVMNRINNWDRYRKLLRMRLGSKDAMADRLFNSGRELRLRLVSGREEGTEA